MKLSHLVPHGTILLAMFCAQLSAEPLQPQPVLISLATENEQAKSCIQLGMRDYLMGWDEMARRYFRQAVQADAESPTGWCGLMLTEGVTPESHSALSRILENEGELTPQESALLSMCLRVLQGDAGGAGEEFAERAEQYRADVLSACWAIRLLHDGYENIGSQWQARPNQKRALEMARKLYHQRCLAEHADCAEGSLLDALAAYMFAWVEESNPTPDEESYQAMEVLATLMPEHPSVQLLQAHVLYKKGELKQAISCLSKAVSLLEKARTNVPHGTSMEGQGAAAAIEQWPMEIRAKLYLSTLLWLDGQHRESLVLQSALLQRTRNITPEQAAAPGAVLLRWEAATLPLRLLMLNPVLPTDSQVAAAQAAVPTLVESGDPLLEVRDCLRFCVVARQRAAAGKGAQALRCIRSAEGCFKRLEAAKERCEGQGGYVFSAWTRACEACRQALFAAKAAAYPDTADIWLDSLEQARRPASMLMPPVLPKRP